MASKKYYVVWVGAKPGIYEDWKSCQAQIRGFPQAKFKSFKTKMEAQQAFGSNPKNYIGKGTKSKSTSISTSERQKIIWNSLSVDAACSGNPGVMEYQGVDTKTGNQYFYYKAPLGTNNIGEFLALVHGLAQLKKDNKHNLPIYSDSRTAIAWVRKKYCNTKLEKSEITRNLFSTINKAEIWLKNNTYSNPILKWETKKWGEIPADFGRK